MGRRSRTRISKSIFSRPNSPNGDVPGRAAVVEETPAQGAADASGFFGDGYANVHEQNNLSDSLRNEDALRGQEPSGDQSVVREQGPGVATEPRRMPPKPRNLFLSSLSPASRQLLVSRSTAVALRQKAKLSSPDRQPTYAYFMTTGIASVVAEMPEGTSAEVGMIGREGIVGALQVLGPTAAPTHCFVQMEGTALRIRLTELKSIIQSSEEIRNGILKLVQKEAMILSQVAGCHRLHSAEERLARWLLMAQDQTQTDTLHFTQALLANMLGARRATVTIIAGALQRAGLIQYHRGHVDILDRKGLEGAACDCYKVIKDLRGDIYRMS